jgi:exodeoxyribonuclease V alpha subunit
MAPLEEIGSSRIAPKRAVGKAWVEFSCAPCDPCGVAEHLKNPASSEKPPNSGESLTLQGTIERITYSNEETLYSVLKLSPEEGYGASGGALFGARLVTAVGRAAGPGIGQRVRLGGDWQEHATHGRQFAFKSFEVLPPTSTRGLERYLASKTFHGIGEKLAKRIVTKLGSGALESIRDEPTSLEGVRGLRSEVAERLVEQVRLELGSHQAHAFLRGLDLGPWQAAAIVEKLGVHTEDLVRRDPYQLAGKVRGIGFGTADRVAQALGIERDDPRRARAGILHALREASDDGHCLQERGTLLERSAELLAGAIAPEALAEALEELDRARDAVVEEAPREDGEEHDAGLDRVYLPEFAHCESMLARNLAALLRAGHRASSISERAFDAAEERAGITLHADQREAVLGLSRTPVGLLTGGPGVGKTTIVRLIVSLAEGAGAKVALASPTGRAAKRLAEATGREAKTIHRLLGFNFAEGGFEHNHGHPLEEDLVIVDEISMLDVVLAHHLLKAIEPPTRLLLVGDPDQLPSVGPGNVLADLISSGSVPTYRLQHIYRQESGSLIVHNAHRLLTGQGPELPERGDRQGDFYFFPAEEPEATADRVIEVVTERIPESFGMEWVSDVQVIAPMYRGPCGVDLLNDRLREAQGIGGLEISRGTQRWRIGDRVIHTRNDYERQVFNGDMGRVVEVQPGSGLTVAFPERNVPYTMAELTNLQPAFAITVHRSQGGEFPAVVIPLVTQHYMMLQRNLLYTAITRARRLVVLVGSRRALQMAVDNERQSLRKSALDEKLRLALALRT